jgi:alpha/beta superfamily hydrolase
LDYSRTRIDLGETLLQPVPMVEEKIKFRSEKFQIEGLLCMQEGERGAVITHPHPLYGGSMYNHVVETLTSVYNGKGFSTLRFNFRGVGLSQGSYGQGEGEKEDVKAALRCMNQRGKRDIDLAGYSFGAWVNAKILNATSTINRAIMVSPPVAFLDFSFLSVSPKIKVVITGDRDEIAPADMVRGFIGTWNPSAHFEIIKGADHFYSARSDTLRSVLSRLIT